MSNEMPLSADGNSHWVLSERRSKRVNKQEHKWDLQTDSTGHGKDLDVDGSSRKKGSARKHVAQVMSNFFLGGHRHKT